MIALTALALPAGAQVINEDIKVILQDDAASDDNFGIAIAIRIKGSWLSGHMAIIRAGQALPISLRLIQAHQPWALN